jgi:hypothetical protein
MALEQQARDRLVRNISAHMAHASGRSVQEHGINQWDVAAHSIVVAVEEILRAEMPRQDPGSIVVGGQG